MASFEKTGCCAISAHFALKRTLCIIGNRDNLGVVVGLCHLHIAIEKGPKTVRDDLNLPDTGHVQRVVEVVVVCIVRVGENGRSREV